MKNVGAQDPFHRVYPAHRYRVEWKGCLAPQELSFDDDPSARASFDQQDREGIADTVARRRAAGQVVLRDGHGNLPPLYRLNRFGATPHGLRLRLGRTDYGEYLYTNVERPERRRVLGDASMSDALAVCATLVTGDRRVLFGARSPRIADGPRAGAGGHVPRYHVLPSGHPEPPHGLFEGLLKELEEETAVTPAELTASHLTGLIRALPSGKPELTFLLETELTFEEIRARSPADAWEFTSLESFPWTARDAEAWLRDHREDAVSPGHAAVLLAAEAIFG